MSNNVERMAVLTNKSGGSIIKTVVRTLYSFAKI